ncbi:MAG: hypothetical protein DI585_03455 [Pseudomonas fluorescens]|nr:MAG: hypothetical protein DI585_03455 [Pseudomonas fluorescens]
MPFSFLKFAGDDEKGDAAAIDWAVGKYRKMKAKQAEQDAATAKESEEDARSGLASLFGGEDEKKDE